MIRFSIFLLVFITFLNASGQKPEGYDEKLKSMYNGSIPYITVFELINEKNDNPKLIILDTREKDEYKISHIEGAIRIGFNKFDLQFVDFLPRNTKIVVYCTIGVRSEIIGEKLELAGFTNVRNLYGGLIEWIYQDQKIVDKKGKETNRIFINNPDWGDLLNKGEKVYD